MTSFATRIKPNFAAMVDQCIDGIRTTPAYLSLRRECSGIEAGYNGIVFQPDQILASDKLKQHVTHRLFQHNISGIRESVDLTVESLRKTLVRDANIPDFVTNDIVRAISKAIDERVGKDSKSGVDIFHYAIGHVDTGMHGSRPSLVPSPGIRVRRGDLGWDTVAVAQPFIDAQQRLHDVIEAGIDRFTSALSRERK